jgi:hypothetical protein
LSTIDITRRFRRQPVILRLSRQILLEYKDHKGQLYGKFGLNNCSIKQIKSSECSPTTAFKASLDFIQQSIFLTKETAKSPTLKCRKKIQAALQHPGLHDTHYDI